MNSIDHGFILCEPMWKYYQQEKNYDNRILATLKRYVKKSIGYHRFKYTNAPEDLILTHPNNYAEQLSMYAQTHAYKVVGLKETYDAQRPFILSSILEQDFSTNIFTFREPCATFNSWKKKDRNSRYHDVEYFIASYEKLYNVAMHTTKQNAIIVHELLCTDPVTYRNNKFQHTPLEVNHMPDLQRKKFVTNTGNMKAIYSNHIEQPEYDTSLLSSHERNRIRACV